MMELRIISPTEDGLVQEIKWNNEELKQEVAARMEEYKGLVITDDQIAAGKKDLASLRKLKTAIEDERKRIKNVCLEPYTKFEKQVKEVTALIDEPINLIDGQIKEYDQGKRVEKMNAIHDFFDANVGDLGFILTFPKVMESHQRWLNASVSMKSIQEEITGLINKVSTDLQTIEGLGTKFDRQIMDVYLQNYDLSTALQEKDRLEEQDRILAERRAAREKEEAARREAEAARQAEQAARQAEQAAAEEANRSVDGGETFVKYAADHVVDKPAEEQKDTAPIYEVSLTVTGTRSELEAFQIWLTTNRITYRTTAKAHRIN
jgi:hypothetical protein